MLLNDGQESALLTLNEIMKSDENRIILSGAAGTGKTTVISEFVNRWRFEVILQVCAPTHTAVNVIRDKLISQKCCTLQSFLKLKPGYDKHGKRVFVPSRETGGFDCDVLIIDESSMISEDLFDIIQGYITCKVIFVGDSYQLPPVNELISKVFLSDFENIELTEQMRTDIYGDLFLQFREFVDTHSFPELDESMIVSKFDIQSVFDEYEEFPDMKLLAHRNAQVSEYNKLIRNTDEEFRINERIMFVDYYCVMFDKFYTGYEITIINCKFIEKYHPWGLKCGVWMLKFKNNGKVRTLQVICKKDKIAYLSMCKKQKSLVVGRVKKALKSRRSTLWAQYYEMAGLYNPPIKYAYSNNVYKSQGQTYGMVRIDVSDIMSTARENKYKCLYTAVTRGSTDIKFIM